MCIILANDEDGVAKKLIQMELEGLLYAADDII